MRSKKTFFQTAMTFTLIFTILLILVYSLPIYQKDGGRGDQGSLPSLIVREIEAKHFIGEDYPDSLLHYINKDLDDFKKAFGQPKEQSSLVRGKGFAVFELENQTDIFVTSQDGHITQLVWLGDETSKEPVRLGESTELLNEELPIDRLYAMPQLNEENQAAFLELDALQVRYQPVVQVGEDIFGQYVISQTDNRVVGIAYMNAATLIKSKQYQLWRTDAKLLEKDFSDILAEQEITKEPLDVDQLFLDQPSYGGTQEDQAEWQQVQDRLLVHFINGYRQKEGKSKAWISQDLTEQLEGVTETLKQVIEANGQTLLSDRLLKHVLSQNGFDELAFEIYYCDYQADAFAEFGELVQQEDLHQRLLADPFDQFALVREGNWLIVVIPK